MSTSQSTKFTRFLKNNAALLLIIFCVLAIAGVVLAVSLSDGAKTDDTPVVVNPNEKGNETPIVEPTTEIVKVYFAAPVENATVTMEYTDSSDVNTAFVFNKTLNAWATHSGIDLAATDGTEVVSMYDGTVIDVSEDYGMGQTIKIDHGENVVATYSSLGDVSVTKGQTVKKGETIGVVSTSASYEFCDGAHLHLEVAVDGKTVDPAPYVNGKIYREVEQEIQKA